MAYKLIARLNKKIKLNDLRINCNIKRQIRKISLRITPCRIGVPRLVGFSFSAVHVPVKLGLLYSCADLQRLSDPYSRCKQCFPRLDDPMFI